MSELNSRLSPQNINSDFLPNKSRQKWKEQNYRFPFVLWEEWTNINAKMWYRVHSTLKSRLNYWCNLRQGAGATTVVKMNTDEEFRGMLKETSKNMK